MLAIIVTLTGLDHLTLARYAGIAYVAFIATSLIYKPWNLTDVGREFFVLAIGAGALVGILVVFEILASIQL